MKPCLRTPFLLSVRWLVAAFGANIRSSARGDCSVGRDGRGDFPCRRCASLRVQTGFLANKLTWQFREPIATLIARWQNDWTSLCRAELAAHRWERRTSQDGELTPGATSDDVPWLKLEVTEQRGNGTLSHIMTVQRVNTKGGVAQGPCESAGAFRSVPYSADYVFLHKDE